MAVRASDRVTLTVLSSISYQRPYYLLQSSTLNPPAKPTTNPPAAPWTATEPGYTAGDTSTLYTVQLTVFGSAGFDYGDVQKSSAYEAAKQAYNLASQAKDAATTADGRLTVSASAPVVADGTGKPIGAVWFRRDASNRFNGAWEWSGTAWATRTIENAMIATLDAAKINTGFLDVSNRVRASAISVRQLLVGDFTNLVEDPFFDLGGTVAWQGTGGTFVADAFQGHATSLRIVGSGERTQSAIPVKAGDRFVFACVYKASGWPSGGAGGLRLQQSSNGGTTWTDLGSTTFGNATAWADSSVEVTIPAGVTHIRVRIASAATGATITLNGFSLRRMNGGELVIDGSLTGRKLNVEEIWANEAWLEVMRAGVIETSMVTAGFGQNLDLSANGSISLVTSVQAELQQNLAQARDDLAVLDTQTAAAAATASSAQAGVSAAQQQVDQVRTAHAATQASLAQTQAYFRFANAEAIIGRTDSPTTLHLRNTGLEIREQGVPVMWATAQQIHVPSLVTGTVVLGNHQLAREGTGTVMRAL